MKRSKKGFTLVEMLVATLILVLLTGAIATGTRTSSTVYTESVFESESEVLASTLNSALADVLRYAYDPIVDGEGMVSAFSNDNYGIKQGHFLVSNGKIYLNTRDIEDSAEDTKILTLVSDGAYSSMAVENFSLTYQAAEGVYSGEYTIAGQTGSSKRTFQFSDRALNG